MILLDEYRALVYDEEQVPDEAIRNSLIKSDMMCTYAADNLLYRFNDKGDLFLASLSHPKFHAVHIGRWDLEFFRREHRLATKYLVVRDVGCEQSRVYLDDYSFLVPTELLLR